MHGPEFHEKKEIDAFLKKLGPERAWWFNPYMAGFGKSGVGDKVLCLCGAFWSIEVKRPGKEPTAIQTRRMNEVRTAGGHAVAGTAEVVIQALTDWLAARGDRSMNDVIDEKDPIYQAIDSGGGQTCDISGVIRELQRAGFAIVPREPTSEMCDASADAGNAGRARAIWKIMVAVYEGGEYCYVCGKNRGFASHICAPG